MRRILLLAIALFLSIGANAQDKTPLDATAAQVQMQTHFLGLNLGRRYQSVEEASSLLDKRFPTKDVRLDEIYVFDPRFGGYDWMSACYEFCGKQSKSLYIVMFQKNFKNRAEAEEMYRSLGDGLERKYGSVELKTRIEGLERMEWGFGGVLACSLNLIQKEMHTCVALVYVDVMLLQLSKMQDANEL
jgi:hypothetical protein